ncbi:hypothetical protein DSO57_1011047 [Entomophthora muscae]|uniref:Uncharacterized protein n=1 Tax=Entomophthora muscae TaxID=34485 RepID=A0ACC2RXE1_9FUNG|nr:hypothetical protein DSO57_1011047 [Entomophthora muscae]
MILDANHFETNIEACSSSRSCSAVPLVSDVSGGQKSKPDFRDFGQLPFGASADKNCASSPQRLKRVPSNPKTSSQYDELKSGNKLKRPKRKALVRKLLPLLQGQAIITPKPPKPQLTEAYAPKSSSRLSNLPPDAIAELKTKSNYQLLREGKTQVLGLDFSDGPSFDRRRIAHKDAERTRRKQQGEQFQVLQKALRGLSEKTSKIDILCLAQETISSNASAIESQAAQIKEILSQFCPQGVQPDFPPELIKWMNPSGG